MKNSDGENGSAKATTLRDHLAIDRTTLANERTLLGYARTALALAVVGASAVKLFESAALMATGWGFLAGGGIVFSFGLQRFLRMKRRIEGRQA